MLTGAAAGLWVEELVDVVAAAGVCVEKRWLEVVVVGVLNVVVVRFWV